MIFEWVDGNSFLSDCVQAELDPTTQCLFGMVRTLEDGLPLFHFLCENMNTMRTAQDFAYRLKMPVAQVESNLERLYEFGLVRRITAVGMTWYDITDEPKQLQAAHKLCTWQNSWHVRLEQIQHALHGKPTFTLSVR